MRGVYPYFAHALRGQKERAPDRSLTPSNFSYRCAQGRNRTTDTGIFSPLLYRLSYLGVAATA